MADITIGRTQSPGPSTASIAAAGQPKPGTIYGTAPVSFTKTAPITKTIPTPKY